MRTLYLDTFSGIAGDMFLGLMLDLGVDKETILTELNKLGLAGYTIAARIEKRCGIAGTYVDISYDEDQPARTWQSIDHMIADSDMEQLDKDLARRIFKRLGEAEAKIHGISLEKVHFHEVGAIDSIIDIVGAAIAINRLGVEQVFCSPLPLGLGSINSAHGTYPLPAPATLEVLSGFPVGTDDSSLELVTPTGAVIAVELATFVPMPEMVIEKIGYGLGTRDLQQRPNVLRGIIGDADEIGENFDSVSVIETHLDDCNPEWLGYLMNHLFENGALDVAYTPLQMKKNRPGIRVTVISPPEKELVLESNLLENSSAIGVRRYRTRRRKLGRKTEMVTTSLGDVALKCLYDDNKLVRVTPEYESCRQLAEQNKVPLPEVYRLAERAADHLFNDRGDL
ncbi:MAG: TIGR00299 family protein [Desulfuromonas sp.]|nr:MAG: TIGR00299 family protein [Desulfuromonas sp.]